MPAQRMSICSSSVAVDFYWYECSNQRHVETAVRACIDAVKDPEEYWDPYLLSGARVAFRRRLARAAAGSLKPLTEVKSLGEDPAVPLFEIRWQDIKVPIEPLLAAAVEADPELLDDPSVDVEVQVRLYFAEPEGFGLAAVGLHVHEKDTRGTSKEIWRAQQQQIDVAADLYHANLTRRWGVPELQHKI